MGNAASNTSDPESPEKSELSHAGSDSPRCLEEKCGGQPCSSSPKMALDQEVLCRSLRERGLCIAESDLESVLANHSNLVEALTHVIDSGLARRSAKVPRGKGVPKRKKHHENLCPVPPASSPTASKAIGEKRARPGEDAESPRKQQQQQSPEEQQRLAMAASRSERPLKRMAGTTFRSMDDDAASDTVFTKAFDATGLAPYIASADVSELVDGMTSEDQTAEARQMQARVLLPVQPGSSPKPRSDASPRETQLKVGSPERDSSPQDVLEVIIERTFEPLPEKLNMGNMGLTMASGVSRWASKTPQEKEEATRAVMKDLCLPWVGLERHERLDESLSRCIHAALEDLANMSNVDSGAVIVANMVKETRKTIHEVTVAVGGKYRGLYGQSSQVGGDNSRESASRTADRNGDRQAVLVGSPGSSGQQQQQQRSAFVSRFYSRSPSRDSRSSGDSQSQQSLQSSGHAFGRSRAVKERARGGIALVGRSSFFPKAQDRQPSSTSVSAGLVGGGGGGGNGGKGDEATEPDTEAAARAHCSPEEAVFWTSCNVCKAALKRTTFARKEGEWLDQQETRVAEKEAQVKGDNMDSLREHELMVANLEDQLRSASETIEASTRDVIGAHVSPQASTEDALRSLLATLQQGQNQSANDHLETRKNALSRHDTLLDTLKSQKARLLLAQHSFAITSVLGEELFGDLLDIISAMRGQANDRRIADQDNLTSTARHVLGKLEVAMRFHITRKRTAEAAVDRDVVNLEETCRLFGNDGLAARVIKARIHEMKVFAADSADKMTQIKRQAGKLYRKMEVDLPEDEFSSLSEGAKEFFSAEADLARAEVGGGNPSRLGMSSGEGMSGVEDGDDCTVM